MERGRAPGAHHPAQLVNPGIDEVRAPAGLLLAGGRDERVDQGALAAEERLGGGVERMPRVPGLALRAGPALADPVARGGFSGDLADDRGDEVAGILPDDLIRPFLAHAVEPGVGLRVPVGLLDQRRAGQRVAVAEGWLVARE